MTSNPPPAPEQNRWRGARILCVLVLVAGLCACWVIPMRLACSGPYSYYTFGYICDEYTYAQRLQPLLPGATRTNPLNGIGDRDAISPYFLDDALRAVITFFGVDSVSVIWVWRILMPCVIALALWMLARICVERRRDGSSKALVLALTALAFPLLHVMYDLLSATLPLQGFINRFPTNIEYPLSIVTAFIFVRFITSRRFKDALMLALLGAALIYARPYAAMPWGITLAAGILWPALRKQMLWSKVWLAAGTVAALLIPFAIVSAHNRQSVAYQQMIVRYLAPQYYVIQPHWILYFSIGAALVAGTQLLRQRRRVIGYSFALPLFILPLVCGHTEFSRELAYDRFAVFYLVALQCVGMQVAARFILKVARPVFGTVIRNICAAGLLVAVALAAENSLYKFESYPFGPYLAVQQELPCVTGYRWLRDQTPPDALILADDGFDWTVPKNEKQVAIVWREVFLGHEDLFSVVSKRKRLYSSRSYINVLTDVDEMTLRAIYLGTFGVSINKQVYAAAIKRFTPDYIFWRNDAHVGRGYGAALRAACEKVYSDESCEIWKLDPAKLNAALPVDP